MENKVRILSIDGGGIRGILPGVVLSRLEQKLQAKHGDPNRRLADDFDFMAGTSTGGILSLAYLIPGKNNRPKFSAEDAVNIYLDRGDEIFDASVWQRFGSGLGLADEKYDEADLEEALDDNFEDVMLSELLKPCIISAYDIRNAKPHFFKQHKAKAGNEIFNFRVKDVARSTSAAPTYFETARVKNEMGTPYPLIDGGVFVNNPALAAYSEARTMDFNQLSTRNAEELKHPRAKDMMIVSLGTGSEAQSYEYKKAKDWGAIGWIKPILEIMMSGNSKTVHYHLTQIYDTLDEQDKADYYRIEPKVQTADSQMDNASVDNMKRLHEDALSYVSNPAVDGMLDEIVEKLIRYSAD